ncbi:leucine-rich repeat protein [Allofournierella massiliensis]|uniref:Leucine rich repeat (LRR) protein n=1 Tax=Allofournierella massiliensis TaxID=1650663 RepID=A0A4R1R1A5_9FIRM|nr:leucine-rich repeat protein [Fournierella massiliensis]TCL59105.1 leucine rich repeat (LRR) protein [Fournierella massiliensis]
MRSVPAECDALLTCCREAGGVALLRCETSAPQLLLPDELDGLPIIRLGDYVFSAREPKQLPEGAFTLRLTSGGEELPAHDAAALRMVRLPQKALSLGNYAFYGCTGLEALEIGGHLQTVGTDAFMNCFSLRRMTLTAPAEECRCLRGLLQEYSGELELCFAPAAGPECRLFFPAYDEDYEEMAAPHIFHYNIRGVGYLCRQSFDGHCFRYDQYDASLDLLLRTHEFSLAVRMAMDRLRFPVQLSETARTAYLSCLEQHTEQVLELVLTEADTAPLSFLLSLDLLGRPALAEGCEMARTARRTEALGLLLEYQNRRFGAPRARSFDL